MGTSPVHSSFLYFYGHMHPAFSHGFELFVSLAQVMRCIRKFRHSTIRQGAGGGGGGEASVNYWDRCHKILGIWVPMTPGVARKRTRACCIQQRNCIKMIQESLAIITICWISGTRKLSFRTLREHFSSLLSVHLDHYVRNVRRNVDHTSNE